MRTFYIAILTAFLLALTGCKTTETATTAEPTQGATQQATEEGPYNWFNDVHWHPYVVKDYKDFEKWAMGIGRDGSTTEGPGLSAQTE